MVHDGPIFSGQFDFLAGDPSILKTNDGYKMYYACYATDIKGTETCLATSEDGLNWNIPKVSESYEKGRVLFPGTEKWDE